VPGRKAAASASALMIFLYRGLSPPLAFKWRAGQFWRAAGILQPRPNGQQSLLHPAQQDLGERIRNAGAANAALVADIIGAACRRFPSLGRGEKTARIEQLIGSDAWTDAALALIDLELPLWHIRRLAYDEGEWHCALSRECELPDWLDQAIETHHARSRARNPRRLRRDPAHRRARKPHQRAGGQSHPALDFYEPLSADNFS